MVQYKTLKKIFGADIGTYFVPIDDTSYKSADGLITLNASLIKSSPEYFKEEAFDLWKPSQMGEAFYIISTDFGTAKLSWDEERFRNVWMSGNCFRDSEMASEASQAVSVLIKTYHKKFSDYIKKNPKQAEMLQSVQESTPAVVSQPPNIPPPPNVPPSNPNAVVNDQRMAQYSPFNKFTTPGHER